MAQVDVSVDRLRPLSINKIDEVAEVGSEGREEVVDVDTASDLASPTSDSDGARSPIASGPLNGGSRTYTHVVPLGRGMHRQRNSASSDLSTASTRSHRSLSNESQQGTAGPFSGPPARSALAAGANSTPPTRKKRISMNFAALPVIASAPPVPVASNSSSSSSTATASSTSTAPSTSPSLPAPPIASPHPTVSPPAKSLPTGATSPVQADKGLSSMETYLSQLAAKERRVVELKDELKRVQDDLKRAELELRLFRDGASRALAPPPVNAAPKPPQSQTPQSQPIQNAVHAVQAAAQTAAQTARHSFNLSTSSQESKSDDGPRKSTDQARTSLDSSQASRNGRNRLSALFLNSSELGPDKSRPKPVQRVSSGSYGACLDPDRSPPVQRTGVLNRPSANLDDRSRPNFAPPDDVINMGKRVVEELGTQFWGLFEDIRSATIGEEPRHVQQQQQQQMQLQYSQAHQPQQYEPEEPINPPKQRPRSNSYYQL